MHIQDLIIQNLDGLIKAKSQKAELQIDDLIAIGAHVGAGVLRGRYQVVKEVKEEEIAGVFGIIGNFYAESFGDAFRQDAFIALRSMAMELLQQPTFDSDLNEFVSDIIKREA
ncbi:hypothetical protein [Flavobacterium sp. JP2137]|uniref:hypothetical protein n=1 Tax=Flavobacterium sp. JP2137 TaxID=3414510 RepID=UPI003D2FA85F